MNSFSTTSRSAWKWTSFVFNSVLFKINLIDEKARCKRRCLIVIYSHFSVIITCTIYQSLKCLHTSLFFLLFTLVVAVNAICNVIITARCYSWMQSNLKNRKTTFQNNVWLLYYRPDSIAILAPFRVQNSSWNDGYDPGFQCGDR